MNFKRAGLLNNVTQTQLSSLDISVGKPEQLQIVSRSRLVTLDQSILSNMIAQADQKLPQKLPQMIALELFDGEMVQIIKQRNEKASSDSLSWIGKIVGYSDSQVILVMKEGIIQGNITLNGQSYQIRYESGEKELAIHSLREIDVSKFPPDHPEGIINGRIPDKTSDTIDLNSEKTSTIALPQATAELFCKNIPYKSIG